MAHTHRTAAVGPAIEGIQARERTRAQLVGRPSVCARGDCTPSAAVPTGTHGIGLSENTYQTHQTLITCVPVSWCKHYRQVSPCCVGSSAGMGLHEPETAAVSNQAQLRGSDMPRWVPLRRHRVPVLPFTAPRGCARPQPEHDHHGRFLKIR